MYVADENICGKSIRNYCLTIKKNKLVIHATTWMNLKCITQSEISQAQKAIWCMTIFMMFWNRQTIGREIRPVIVEVDYKGVQGFFFFHDRAVLYLDCVGGYTTVQKRLNMADFYP